MMTGRFWLRLLLSDVMTKVVVGVVAEVEMHKRMISVISFIYIITGLSRKSTLHKSRFIMCFVIYCQVGDHVFMWVEIIQPVSAAVGCDLVWCGVVCCGVV